MFAGASKQSALLLTQAVQSAEQASERSSGALLGGYKEASTSDSEVTEAANFAAEQLSQRSNSLYPFKVKEVQHFVSLIIDNIMPQMSIGTVGPHLAFWPQRGTRLHSEVNKASTLQQSSCLRSQFPVPLQGQ